MPLWRVDSENTVECTCWLPLQSPNPLHLQEPVRIKEWNKRWQPGEDTFAHSSNVLDSTALLWARCGKGQGRACHHHRDRALAVILPPSQNKTKQNTLVPWKMPETSSFGKAEQPVYRRPSSWDCSKIVLVTTSYWVRWMGLRFYRFPPSVVVLNFWLCCQGLAI